MRHLSTSLPNARRRRQDQPEILSDFRAAALSVTNLYKSAAASQTKARNAGYQDALDDLLVFLDKENLGLMDGEGWRVRRWATERLDDSGQRQSAGSEDEDEAVAKESSEEPRAPSPEAQKKPTLAASSSEPPEEPSPARHNAPEPTQPSPAQPAAPLVVVPASDTFTFRADIQYPTNHPRELTTMDLDSSPSTNTHSSATEGHRIVSKTVRNRHTNHNRRENRQTINLNLGPSVGSKRKNPYNDFFDISGVNFDWQDKKDGNNRGGKRGRHT
jgi:hypothetical protein